MPLMRISITIPEDLVAEADRKAADLDRSRSWVLVDALRDYLGTLRANVDQHHVDDGKPPQVSAVHEPQIDYAAGLGSSRIAQLVADMRLSPEERVLAAERTLAIGDEKRPPRDRVLSFDRYDDYVEWKKREAIGR